MIELSAKKKKTKEQILQKCIHIPALSTFPFLVGYQCVLRREGEILMSSKGALNSKHLETLEDHQGSPCPFITECSSLPPAPPPPPPLPLPVLPDVVGESSPRLPDNPDTQAPSAASF